MGHDLKTNASWARQIRRGAVAAAVSLLLAACGTPAPVWQPTDQGPHLQDVFADDIRAAGEAADIAREPGKPVYRLVYATVARARWDFIATLAVGPDGGADMTVVAFKQAGVGGRWHLHLASKSLAAFQQAAANSAVWALPPQSGVNTAKMVCGDGPGMQIEAWDGQRFVRSNSLGGCETLPAFDALTRSMVALVQGATGILDLGRVP